MLTPTPKLVMTSASPKLSPAPVENNDPEDHEKRHVHQVYDQIAPHFSSTRYKVRSCIFLCYIALPTSVAMAHYCRVYDLLAAWIGWLGFWNWQR